MSPRLDGKVAVVTGGAGGIGAATVRLMVAEGARVVVGDLDAQRLQGLVDDLGSAVVVLTADVRREADIAALIGAAVERFGRLDVLHNNAVAALPDDTDVVGTPDAAWRDMFDVVVMAAVLGCRHAIPAMQGGGGGSIVNMSSGAARAATGSKIAYGTMKAALETLSLYTAASFGADGIRSNVVAPGFVLTDGTRELFDEAGIERFAAGAASGRLCVPEDVAEVVVFLASDEARYVSGEVVRVNGGGSRVTAW
ncbi:MAG TPA: SDR family oxidoreductase [Frankiaceae bacterium]|nr:SDR family oxidoreductase [Frankiaceae bacterium]